MLDGLTMTLFDHGPYRGRATELSQGLALARAGHPAQTRQILRKLLTNQIRVWRGGTRGREGLLIRMGSRCG
mgnify:FL=1